MARTVFARSQSCCSQSVFWQQYACTRVEGKPPVQYLVSRTTQQAEHDAVSRVARMASSKASGVAHMQWSCHTALE